MLDSMQNSVVHKTDSLTTRPHSPSAEVSKLENKFQDMFAKSAQSKVKTAQNTKEAQGSKEVSKVSVKDSKNTQAAKIDKPTPQPSKAQTADKLPTANASAAKESQLKANASLMPFDFKDSTDDVSKIGLQDKIAKTSKEAKVQENNPLIEALSAPLQTKATDASSANNAKNKVENNSKTADSKGAIPSPLVADSKGIEQKIATQNITESTIAKSFTESNTDSVRMATMPQPQKTETEVSPKTLADVEAFAKAKGLAPSNITLLDDDIKEAQITRTQVIKTREIPTSAKESISYEYENNVDRIAIVKRGTKKPKNFTSKISNEYPTKKTDNEKGSIFSLKDGPQLS